MKRLLTSVWLVLLGVSSIFYAPHWVFVGVVCMLAAFCYREYSRIVENQGLPAFFWVGLTFGFALLAAPGVGWADLAILAPIALGLSLRAGDFKASFASAGAFALGILYVFGAWRCGIALHEKSMHLLFFATALNWAGDSSAYFVGRAIGKHKLAPEISPGKSIEGAIASVAASVLFGCLYLPRVLPNIGIGEAAVLSIVGNVAGQLGDLCESALKRGAGMKDSGTMLAGHGGWLDRLDSSLFSMPAVFWLLSLYSR